ncbi:uncharacterized protein [Atheta coriaria]|uniref:uncharacterized protein isoform X1 n=2 Tax=Dalotia coriaria TaxID=877792 RepID=UPI0031F35AF8
MNERHAPVKNPNIRVNNHPVCPRSYSVNAKPNSAVKTRQIHKYKSFNNASFHKTNAETTHNSVEVHNLWEGVHYQRRHVPEEAMHRGACVDEESAGLSLELEIDESIKNLLRQGSLDKLDKNSNKYLDVTFIQQPTSPTPVQATVSLGMDEVSQLIDMVHAKNNKPTNKTDKLSTNPVSSEVLQNYSTDYTSDYSDGLYSKGIVPPKSQQIYTTPQTFNDIRSKLPCMVHSQAGNENYDKPTPCLCQHCGMVGVLVESQKRPAIPHSPNPKFANTNGAKNAPQTHSSRVPKKVVDLRAKSKSETNLILLKELTAKITSLEDRLNEHEEKTVKKDYFKFVIHKLLTQYSNKINELRTTAYYSNKQNVNMATQYCRKSADKSDRSERSEKEPSRFYPVKVPNENRMNVKSSSEEVSSERYYKRPTYKSKVPKRTTNTSFTRSDHPKAGTHVSTNVKTMFMTNDQNSNRLPQPQENLSAHAIKNLCGIVYNKYCDIAKQNEAGNRERVVPEKLKPAGPSTGQMSKAQPAGPARNRKEAQSTKRMNVAYVSPALETWHDESEQECVAAKNIREHEQKREQQQLRNNSGHAFEARNKTKHSVEEKVKYLKYLAKRKNVDESELWSNILNQARKHIRSNEDTVSIQLPSLPHGPDMSELELTLSKLKVIVKTSRQQRTKQPVELDCCSSSERLNPFFTIAERKRKPSAPTSYFVEDEPHRQFVAR